MISLKNVRDHATIKRIAAIPLFLVLVAALTFCEQEKTNVVNPDDSVVTLKDAFFLIRNENDAIIFRTNGSRID